METIQISKANTLSKASSRQYIDLKKIVEDNKTIENDFFDQCRNGRLPKNRLIAYLFNWYPITESFAVYGLLYAHIVAKFLQKNIESSEFKNIESFFCDVLEISKGEFEIIHIAPNNFHPKAFTRLAPKLSVKIKDLISRNYKLNPETIILEKNIISNFSNMEDILCGFSNFFVVETIALGIVKSMQETFGKLVNEDGSPLYSTNEMLYISEHLDLEVKHGNDVRKMLDKLNLTDKKFSLLSIYVNELSLNFYKFWMALCK
jgi:pyrroloquinoline quinone (PQQ) biosynthesis protein C